MEKTRKIWVDNVKVIAIILVALGHLLQSFVKSGVIADSTGYKYLIQTIYLFHVPLFFICSGFLYQYLTKKQNFKAYSKNILKKLVALGIPYFVFSGITYLLKFIFSSSVNTENEGNFFHTLFVDPVAPYWFLYALFFLFLVSPILKSKADAIIRFVLAVVLYTLSVTVDFSFLPAVLNEIVFQIFNNLIWFVIGMELSFFDFEKNLHKIHGLAFIVFLFMSVPYFKNLGKLPAFLESNSRLIYGVFACMGIISFIGAAYKDNKQTKIFGFLSKYTMPIFLMHTIFAAACRSVLFKIGIHSAPVHIAVGLLASFAFPIIAAMIMEKIKLDILYNPTKYIKIK